MESPKSKTRSVFRKNSILTKIGILSIILLLSSIPRFVVESTIEERKEVRAESIRSVTEGWAARQIFGRFELALPYEYFVTEQVVSPTNSLGTLNVQRTQVQPFVVIPEIIDVQIDSSFETRKRGIFEVPVFSSDIVMKGRITIPQKSAWPQGHQKILWDQASLRAGFANPETLQDFSLVADGQHVAVKRSWTTPRT